MGRSWAVALLVLGGVTLMAIGWLPRTREGLP